MILNFDKEDKKTQKKKTMVVNELNLDVIAEDQDDLEESRNFDAIDQVKVTEKPMETIQEKHMETIIDKSTEKK